MLSKHPRSRTDAIGITSFSCASFHVRFWIRKKENGGLTISSDGNNKPHVNDIYIHSESMCCQRWCDTFPDWGSCYGNMTHHKSSCFTCASCTVLMKAISCSFCLPTSSAEPQRSITHHIRCLGEHNVTQALENRGLLQILLEYLRTWFRASTQCGGDQVSQSTGREEQHRKCMLLIKASMLICVFFGSY